MPDQSPITPKPGIMDIALYQGGSAKIQGRADAIKLSSNENPYGPSPAAQAALVDSATGLHRYPNTDHASLRAAIGAVHGLDPDRIICGVGSDEVLQFAVHCFAGPGDEIIMTRHGFSMYPILTRMVGATAITVPERDRRVDVDAILAAVSPRTRIVFLTNPGNPTSTMLDAGELLRLAKALPSDVLLIHDGAYSEFVGNFRQDFDLVEAFPNVLMTRTFSKIYGLGGLRIGWGYGPREIIDVLNRIRGPFNLSAAQQEAAEAAVRDRDYLEKCRAENARMRHWLAEALAEKGVPSDVSMANFILARFGSEAMAIACDEALRAEGLIVRRVAGYGLPDCLRITVGDEPSCRRVAHVIGLFMAEYPQVKK